jgi:WD40 repeat protein
LATRKETQRFQIDVPDTVRLAAYSPDGKIIAVHGAGCTIYLFDTATGKLARRVACRRGLVTLLFSPDGKTLGGIDSEGVCQIWDPANGKRIEVFAGPGEIGYPTSLVFTRDNKLLAWTGRGHAACVWDVRTGKTLTPDGGLTGAVVHMGFSGEGKTLVCVGQDGVVCTWDVASAKETRRWRVKQDFPGMRIQMGAAMLSPDGRYVAVASLGSSGNHLCDVSKGLEICRLSGQTWHSLSMTFSPDGTRLAANIHDQSAQAIRVWDVDTGQDVVTFKADAGDVAGLAYSADGKMLAMASNATGPGGWQANIRLVDAATGKERRRIDRPNEMLRLLVFNDGLSRIAVAQQRGVLYFLSASGEEIRKVVPPAGFVVIAGPVISHNGRTVATVYGKDQSNECTLQLWELASGSLRREFSVPTSHAEAIAISRDGRKVAVACADTSILIFDTTGGIAAAIESLSADAADALWTDLKAAEAQKADAAIWRLASSPKEAILVLKKHLKAVEKTTVTEKQIAQWILQLDNDDFDKREKATRELEGAGPQAKAALQKALDGGKLSNEAKGRVENLLQRLAKPRDDSAEMIQPLRAIEVLEHLATAEAKELLTTLANGDPDALLTREAKSALERLSAKP